jgi:hypothetical protein
MFRSLIVTVAREGRQQAQRHFSAAAAGGAGALVAKRAAVLLPSAALGLYAAVGDEPRRVAFTVSVLPARLTRDFSAAIRTVAGELIAFPLILCSLRSYTTMNCMEHLS